MPRNPPLLASRVGQLQGLGSVQGHSVRMNGEGEGERGAVSSTPGAAAAAPWDMSRDRKVPVPPALRSRAKATQLMCSGRTWCPALGERPPPAAAPRGPVRAGEPL